MRVQIEAGAERHSADHVAHLLQQMELRGRIGDRCHRAMQREVDRIPSSFVEAGEDALADAGECGRLDQPARRRRGAMQVVELPIWMLRLDRQHAADLGRRAGIELPRRLAAHPLARLKGGKTGAQRRKAVCLVPQTGDGKFAFSQVLIPLTSAATLAMKGKNA